MPNRLAGETSPYLLQHKDNPVDWYPWGQEALTRSRDEDKPILLSIGYAACHWCHVMERESFEDAHTARFMNEHFVCIKVDREERPDLDAVYMDAVQAMTGQGGWPMTVWLTPQGKPFYGGTYFPPQDRHGLPAFGRLLAAIEETWRERRGDAEEQGTLLLGRMGALGELRATDTVDVSFLEEAVGGMEASFDSAYGGFGGAPKFPQPMTIEFLLRRARSGDERARSMAATTLDAMAAGGMFDQLGGGWHRYSVDARWIVPHFEKMLYDNAQLLLTYALSYQLTGTERHRQVARATAAWMLAEMRDASGGFYSSVDADSEGEEGKYYIFTLDEVRTVAGADADIAIAALGITTTGNFEGKNIPIAASAPVDETAYARARDALLEHRARRIRPGTDTKVLTAWNGMAASALARAGRALAEPDWVEAAARALEFVLGEMRVDGRLMRSYRAHGAGAATVKHLAYAEDYAFTLEACLALYEATFEERWLREAVWAAGESIRLFADPSGGFFTTGTDAEPLVTRPKDLIDNAVPAANSVFALELQRLTLLTGDRRYEDAALGILGLLQAAARRSPLGFGHLLCAFDLYASDAKEVVVVGNAQDATRNAMLDVLDAHYLPNTVRAAAPPDALTEMPLFEGRGLVDGKTAAYVCHRGACRMPVTTTAALMAELSL